MGERESEGGYLCTSLSKWMMSYHSSVSEPHNQIAQVK